MYINQITLTITEIIIISALFFPNPIMLEITLAAVLMILLYVSIKPDLKCKCKIKNHSQEKNQCLVDDCDGCGKCNN